MQKIHNISSVQLIDKENQQKQMASANYKL